MSLYLTALSVLLLVVANTDPGATPQATVRSYRGSWVTKAKSGGTTITYELTAKPGFDCRNSSSNAC